MAICRINGLIENNQEIIANINLLIRLLEEKHENEKAWSITEKLKERLDLIKKVEKPWWKKMF
jgi:DNA-binding transcriptional regulator GbsR (MarR family)